MQDLIAHIRDLLNAQGPVKSSGNVIAAGTLTKFDGSLVAFQLCEGWDMPLANRCDATWGTFNVRLMRHIRNLQLSGPELHDVINQVQLDDSHWRWLNKAVARRGDEYRWFFLMADEEPQAACLIFHPKPSAEDGRHIYYIDYLAVAPWNRANPMDPQTFKGLGKLVIRHVADFAEAHLGLVPGMCLHSLPKAEAFYQKMGMKRFPSHDKDGLPYYELCGPLPVTGSAP
jgi:hypothetical protein